MDDILDRRNGSPVQEEIKEMDRSLSCTDSGVRSLRFKARYYFKRAEKLTMCLVVDAVERMVKLMHNDCNNPKYCLLQKLSEKQLKTFGIVLAESELEDDDYIHCDLCGVYYRASCRLHPLFIVSDREPRAEQTLPAFFEIKTSKIPKAGLGVFAKMDIPIGLVFGPYQGILLSDPKKADQNGYSWEIRISGKPSQYIDGSDPRYSNWMRYINSSRSRPDFANLGDASCIPTLAMLFRSSLDTCEIMKS
uniref:SET domain-containing protein n=1 Tax=Setaria digitata TaxID=48799 RepID=A0A915Q0V5_9BILA